MDKNDEKADQMSEDPKNDDYSSDEDIPLWLQGLDDDDGVKSKPVPSEEDVKDSWVPEITDELSDEDLIIDENDPEIEAPSETSFSHDYDHMMEKREAFENGPTEEIEIDNLPNGAHSDDIGPELNDIPSSEGFVEISDMETSEFSNQEEPIHEEEPLIEGDLPEWLQEMIAEQEKSKPGDIDDELLDESDLLEEQPLEDENITDDLMAVDDGQIEQDQMVRDDESEIEDAFDTEFVTESDQENDLDSDWLLEEDLESDEEITDEEDFYFGEASANFDMDAALEISEDVTKPVQVLKEDDEEDSSLILDDPFIDEAFAKEDDEALSLSSEEPFVEEPQTEDEDDLLLTLDDPYVEEAFAVADTEDLSLTFDEPLQEPQSEDQAELSQAPEDEEKILPVIESTSDEETHFNEDEDVLDGIKNHLAEGKFDDAIPMINEIMGETTHLDELETWLRKAAESYAEHNSDIWEALGDISVKQNKPDEAFQAYAKAIQQLLISKEVSDETR